MQRSSIGRLAFSRQFPAQSSHCEALEASRARKPGRSERHSKSLSRSREISVADPERRGDGVDHWAQVVCKTDAGGVSLSAPHRCAKPGSCSFAP
jgi:hypothetical protein